MTESIQQYPQVVADVCYGIMSSANALEMIRRMLAEAGYGQEMYSAGMIANTVLNGEIKSLEELVKDLENSFQGMELDAEFIASDQKPASARENETISKNEGSPLCGISGT